MMPDQEQQTPITILRRLPVRIELCEVVKGEERFWMALYIADVDGVEHSAASHMLFGASPTVTGALRALSGTGLGF